MIWNVCTETLFKYCYSLLLTLGMNASLRFFFCGHCFCDVIGDQGHWKQSGKLLFNLFKPNVLFQYPPETSENLTFDYLTFSGGIEMEPGFKMG